MLDKQSQTATEGGAAIQAGRDIILINQGTSAAEVREIAREVCKSVLSEYTGMAIETARIRGERIVERLIEKLLIENPEAITQAQTPEFQDALHALQREHAKIGDDELGDLLVDLLVDQTKEASRSLLRNVLNEALRTAPRLAPNQIATLSAMFVLFNVTYEGANSLEELGKFLDQHLKPFIPALPHMSEGSLSHLEFVGCGSFVPFTQNSLEANFSQIYAGLFQKGMGVEEIKNMGLSDTGFGLITRCLNNPELVQVAALNESVLVKRAQQLKISNEDERKLLDILKSNTMAHDQIREKLLPVASYLSVVFDLWEKSPLKSFSLTVIGRAIAHANIKKSIGGDFAPLSIWIA